jgi:hypothetical protein
LPLKTPFGQQKKRHLPALSFFLLQGIFNIALSFQSVKGKAFGRLVFILKLFSKKTTLLEFQSFFFAPIFSINSNFSGEAAPEPQRIIFYCCFARCHDTTKNQQLNMIFTCFHAIGWLKKLF